MAQLIPQLEKVLRLCISSFNADASGVWDSHVDDKIVFLLVFSTNDHPLNRRAFLFTVQPDCLLAYTIRGAVICDHESSSITIIQDYRPKSNFEIMTSSSKMQVMVIGHDGSMDCLSVTQRIV